jgi:hypothetical protein
VTLFARTLPPRGSGRLSRLAATLAASAAVAFLFSAAPAHAIVAEVSGTKVGLQPRNSVSVIDGPLKENVKNEFEANPSPETFANNAGNPVLHSNATYAVYWDPTDTYHGDWQHLINTFFHDLGAGSGSLASVFGVDAQYTDTSNQPAYFQSTFRGGYTDTHGYPGAGCTDPHPLVGGNAITCLTDSQLRAELAAYIAQHNLPKGMNTIYYLLTPPGVSVCVDAAATRCSSFARSAKEDTEVKFESASYVNSFCSYHSDINPDNVATGNGNTILYAAIPWTAGGAHDGHLAVKDQTQAPECQDGGFNPSSKPPEQREEIKTRNAQEQKEFLEKSPEEQEKLEQQTALQGPHNQEPNQVACPSPDGYCDTGLADLIINQIAVEHQNTVTNPMLNAWQDSARNEVSDECRNWFAPQIAGTATANPETGAGSLYNQSLNGHGYYMNSAFNLAALRLPYPGIPCLTGARLVPQFTSPTTVNSGETVTFDGMESNISLNAAYGFSAGGAPQANYATYTWDFGDGSAPVQGYAPGAPACEAPWLSPCAASVLHSYQYGGSYSVTLTVTDVGGHVASVSNPVSVSGAPAPAKQAGGGSSGGGGAAGAPAVSPASAGGGSAARSTPIPPPVAAAAVISRSLKTVLRKGLVIRYSVNEQVAGHFEVLLNRSTARRLGIGGAPAFGLPAGTPAQLVIGKAILVTTAAGRSTVTIQFSKRTASHLARSRKVTLMVRLIVRNAASSSPATTTVLSSFTLTH